MGEWLGIGLVNLVNIFNPEVIVIGGNLRDILPLVSGVIDARLRSALPAAREQVRVTLPGLDGESTLIGAAETAFDELLSDPIEVLSRSDRDVAS